MTFYRIDVITGTNKRNRREETVREGLTSYAAAKRFRDLMAQYEPDALVVVTAYAMPH